MYDSVFEKWPDIVHNNEGLQMTVYLLYLNDSVKMVFSEYKFAEGTIHETYSKSGGTEFKDGMFTAKNGDKLFIVVHNVYKGTDHL